MIVLTVFILVSSSYPQINQTIGDFEGEIKSGDMIIGKRPFIGTFEFESLPEPLKPTRVNFTFEVNRGSSPSYDREWEIRLTYHPKGIRILSDTVFYWPQPHNLGDQYTGYFEFSPLCSGLWNISFHLHGASMITSLNIAYTLDQDGNIIDIGKEDDVRGYDIVSTFFNEDSIYFTQMRIGPRELFKYNFVVKPLFRIGDTSTITYYLTALGDAPAGVDIEVDVDNMQITSLPERISEPVMTGDTLILNIKVIPRAITDEHRISLKLKNSEKDDPDFKYSKIICGSVFKNDGKLRFTRDMLGSDIEQQLLPEVYQVGNPGFDEAVIIPKEESKKIIRREHYKVKNEN